MGTEVGQKLEINAGPHDGFRRCGQWAWRAPSTQAVLAGRHTAVSHTLNHPDFRLRRFVICDACNIPLTGSAPKAERRTIGTTIVGKAARTQIQGGHIWNAVTGLAFMQLTGGSPRFTVGIPNRIREKVECRFIARAPSRATAIDNHRIFSRAPAAVASRNRRPCTRRWAGG